MTLSLDPATHIYRLSSGLSLGASVSSLVNRHWPSFDAAVAARRCGPSARLKWTGDPNASDDKVMAAWSENGRQAAKRGTEMHERIEKFLLGETCHGLDDTTSTWLSTRFKSWTLEPEKKICGSVIPDGRLIPGTIDLLALDPNGNYWIFDWKRGSVDDEKGDRDEITGLAGTKLNRYSLQLSFYASILKNNYDIIVPVERRKLVRVLEDETPIEIDPRDLDPMVGIVAALEA
jgi:hypothetical protein